MSDSIKRWRCNVCGTIVEGVAPPDKCPVCAVGPENFEALDEESAVFTSNEPAKIVIVGGGIAALSAAASARKRNNVCDITIISEENFLPYNRPLLTKNLFGRQGIDMTIKKEDWYTANNIKLMRGEKVIQINVNAKYVKTENGSDIKYDKLILAIGASAFIPPIAGHEQRGVFAIRKMTDMQQIRDMIESVESVVIIGGGVLGLEAAWELQLAGKNTVILEPAPALMGRQLDEEASGILKESVEAHGVKCLTGIAIDKIAGDGSVSGVLLKDGTLIDAQLVIMSTGVRANIALAQQAGINAEKNIVINGKAETNVQDIYACGDCAEFDGINYAIIPQAEAQGITAGANAVGDNVIYRHENPANYFDGFGIKLFAIGDNGKKENVNYDKIAESSGGNYKKLYFTNGKFTGGILMGDISDSEYLKEAYKSAYSREKMTK